MDRTGTGFSTPLYTVETVGWEPATQMLKTDGIQWLAVTADAAGQFYRVLRLRQHNKESSQNDGFFAIGGFEVYGTLSLGGGGGAAGGKLPARALQLFQALQHQCLVPNVITYSA